MLTRRGGIPERMTLTERSNRIIRSERTAEERCRSSCPLRQAETRVQGRLLLPVGGVEGEAEPPPADLPQKKIFEEIRQITTYKIVP